MMGQMGVEYVMRTAILFSLLLEIKERNSNKHEDEKSHTHVSDRYENYENQF